jgi:thioredoxin reductase (NADPH)
MVEAGLAIIGGGVAGLTAGLYAARERLNTVLLERMGTGGQLINTDQVENFPGFPGGIKGYELGPLIAQQAMDAGLRVEYSEAMRIRRAVAAFEIETDGEPVLARAVIIAAGSTLARLGVAGEAEFEGRGVSYCATCDGEFFRDQPVAVVGGGDSAMDEALYLAPIASQVTVIHRRDELRATRVLQELAQAQSKITFKWNTEVEAIEGGDTVQSLRLRDPNGVHDLSTAGVFIYTGLRPNSQIVDGLIERDAGGHIAVDQWMRTEIPGLLAAGDIRAQSARQLISAAGDGATAAMAAVRYVRAGDWG